MSSEKTEDKSLTFVQITDAHLFDSGKRENPGTERIDTRLAWDWALLQINQMVLSGRRIDFVVFTGDFGLENLKDCAALQKGAELVADDLANLLVKKVLLVRGNNDLTDEDPEDAGRFDAFVGFLSGHIQKFKNEEKAKPPREERIKLDEIVNLTPAPTMAAPKPASLWCIAGTGPQYSDWGNIRFLGLDSSSFKNSKIKDCRRTLTPERYDRQLAEFQRVEQIVNKDGKLNVLFTHVPDLDDPLLAQNCPQDPASWKLNVDSMQVWDRLAPSATSCGKLLAVFAGHLHDNNPWKYLHPYEWQATSRSSAMPGSAQPGTSARTRNLKLEEITYLTPPLAAKFQLDKSLQARGLRVTTISASGAIKSDIFWFTPGVVSSFVIPSQSPNKPPDRNNEYSQQIVLWMIAGIGYAGLITIGVIHFNKSKPS